MSTEELSEARRQIEICNACRYCEGYCAVFPAITRKRIFNDGDVTQLANLCHNCRGCHYACQYSEPHEFKINIPQALGQVRVQSWQRFVPLRSLSTLFHKHGVALSISACLAFAFIFWVIITVQPDSGDGFYAALAHATMISIFIPAFIAPLLIVGIALRRYWLAVGGQRLHLHDISAALKATANMKNLSGGQGQGCNFEQGDKFSNKRRWYHQATFFGFLLCFASTISGTILHYLADMPAPYPLWSIPKLLGVPGGVLLVIGCAGLACLKCKADPELDAQGVWGADMAFIVLLGLTGASGLILYIMTGTQAVPALLALHLGIVLAFFITTPFSKMVHGFFRLAALLRDAQQQRG